MSIMDGTLQFLTNLSNLSDHRLNGVEFNGNEEEEEEVQDTEAWETITKCFKEVQSVLDQNRVLIQQVNENHESKVPDNMVKNVALIRDINSNISKVSRLYSNLSRDFCNIVHQRRTQALCETKNRDDDVDTAES
ncbi:protein EARLY FLOWERING 4-like [Lycium barbarum]|uniref:protein EARLY FLOWERING 4-like n=1 Tax=Lycium barbarum TaxID=112863 RepID=UPI00293F5248|nr:protein EARLY FLOWERING 4-like [Lycium barbarum]